MPLPIQKLTSRPRTTDRPPTQMMMALVQLRENDSDADAALARSCADAISASAVQQAFARIVRGSHHA